MFLICYWAPPWGPKVSPTWRDLSGRCCTCSKCLCLPRGCPSLAPSSVHKACVQRCRQQALKPASNIPFSTHLVQASLFSTFSCSQINFLLNRKIQSNGCTVQCFRAGWQQSALASSRRTRALAGDPLKASLSPLGPGSPRRTWQREQAPQPPWASPKRT